MSQFIPRSHVSFAEVTYLEKYPLRLPAFAADWDAWHYWEMPRIRSIAEHLKQGDTLIDVGSETGWMSIALAKIVGPENLVLVEPTPENWPNIRATWEENFIDALPRATFYGLMDREPKEDGDVYWHPWPECSETGLLNTARSFRYLHEHLDQTPVATIDKLCGNATMKPKGLTIDVEGAELRVLQGAKVCLKDLKPFVWVSVHPDLMLRDYGATPADLHEFMTGMGYTGELLHIDHETHYFFKP